MNVGATRGEAFAAQPIKHADALVVGPVQDCVIREDNGQVIGSGRAAAVGGLRLPGAGPERDRVGPQHRILRNHDNRAGSSTCTPFPGSATLRVRAAVPVDGVLRLSASADAEIDTSAVLAPVGDLSVTALPGAGGVFDLWWTAPSVGQVAIYRTDADPGRRGGRRTARGRARTGRAHPRFAARPAGDRAGGSAGHLVVMSGVSWPGKLRRAYFTPVTLLAGRALLGTTLSSVVPG